MSPVNPKQYLPNPDFLTYQETPFSSPQSSQHPLPEREYHHGGGGGGGGVHKVDCEQSTSHEGGSHASMLKSKKSISDDANKSSATGGSGKWMSSKMRLMRKLRNADEVINMASTNKKRSTLQTPQQQQQDRGSSCNDTTSRVCSDCNTTKTPLWRGGPQGPKSLCNACGIRQRKARKAMGAAAAAATSSAMNDVLLMGSRNKEKGSPSSSSSSSSSRDSDEHLQANIPYKKRFKILYSESEENKLIFDDRSSDVNEAAILLMALSSDHHIICG